MAKPSKREKLVLNGRFGILPETRLPDCDSPNAQAYAAVDLASPKARVFGLICDPDLPPRNGVLPLFAKLAGKPILFPEDWGVIDWPATGGRASAIVLRRPAGPRLLAPGAAPARPLRDSDVKHKILMPLLPVFRALEEQSLTHCAVRADNLFFDGTERSAVVLGEGFSEPPGYSQPAIYETIERGMAMPAGRGAGRVGDDLYALGITLAILALGRDPCAGMSAQEVVTAKLRAGTYAALVGGARLPLQLLELLRGLLCDDRRDRWTVADLEMWVNARHICPKQPVLPAKAQRPFDLAGESCWSARTLAHAMARNWDAAARAVSTDAIGDWLRRSLLNDKLAESVAEAELSVQSASPPALAKDLLVAETLVLLDPGAPLRYKDLAASVDSLGQVLAIEFERAETRQTFVEAVTGGLPQAWFAAQPVGQQWLMEIRRDLHRAKELLGQWGSEIGVVRCLYELNPDGPCRSPLLAKRNVTSVPLLLEELERLAGQGPPDEPPVDLHIGAFCAARLRHTPKQLLAGLFRPEDERAQRMAMLTLLGTAQRESGSRPFPALAGWLVRSLGPVVETYRNRVLRSQIAKEVERQAAKGDLAELAALIDSETTRGQDAAGFQKAKARFDHAVREIAWLEAGGLTNRAHVTRGSQQVAMLVSASLSGLGLVTLSLIYAL
jgi:hypothetical protein